MVAHAARARAIGNRDSVGEQGRRDPERVRVLEQSVSRVADSEDGDPTKTMTPTASGAYVASTTHYAGKATSYPFNPLIMHNNKNRDCVSNARDTCICTPVPRAAGQEGPVFMSLQ